MSILDPREIKRSCDFFAIASRYTRLQRVGRQHRALCPFHSERNPSLYIEPQRKIWKCFGCERGGDVFMFVTLAENCSFVEAVRIVAGVARECEPRSGERLRARVGAGGPSARAAGVQHSPNSHDSILARLDETERRKVAIARTNTESFTEFERDCEPRSGEPLLEKTG